MTDFEKKLNKIDVTIDCLTLLDYMINDYTEEEAVDELKWLIDEKGENENAKEI